MKTRWLMFALAAAATGCAGSGAQSATPAAGAPAAAASYFTVPAAQMGHVQVVQAQTAQWTTTVATTGTVDWDNDQTTQAIPQISGPITRIVVDTGSRVKAGDPLLYVESPDAAAAISDYRKATNRLDLARRTLDRSKDLLAHQAIAQRDLEAAEADFNDASTDLQTSLEALRILGLTPADLKDAETQDTTIRPELPMRAPIAGTVVQKLVLPGQLLQAGSGPAFVISDTAKVWVQGHVYEKDLRSVHLGDKVDLRTPAFPETFHGTITYIGDLIDPDTRTTPVRIVTDNPNGHLKKDLFLDVTIAGRSTRDVLTVPTDAVLYDEQNFPFVYLQVSPGQFAQRTVTIGGQQGDRTEITSGLKAGDPVVAQGSLFLQFANSFNK